MSLDINKFSFGQLTSNSDGKTSGSGTSGVYIVFLGMICFTLGVIDKMFLTKSADIMSYSLMAVTVGAGLLGYRKSIDKSQVPNIEDTLKEVIEDKTSLLTASVKSASSSDILSSDENNDIKTDDNEIIDDSISK